MKSQGKVKFLGFDTYPEMLRHLASLATETRASNAPTVISTFAGGGGSSTGYHMAGFRELLVVEWEDNAAAVLKANYPKVKLHHGDIANLTVSKCLELAKIKEGELDVFDGSPPCQGFSISGKRDATDERNQLFREYIRLLKGLQPKVFVMENVTGMVKGQMKLVFVKILKELKECGYRVSCKTLKAINLNVPQMRQRVIFVGVREDLAIEPSHPAVSNRSPISFEEATLGITHTKAELEPLFYKSDTQVGRLFKDLPQGKSGEHLKGKGKYFNYFKIDPKKVCPTLTKGSMGNACHHTDIRMLSAKELKRLGSFPDNYKFIGKLINTAERIGNSVPPVMMYHIAKHIKENILEVG